MSPHGDERNERRKRMRGAYDTLGFHMNTRPYQSLIVWKEAHKLCIAIYGRTKIFPPEEKFGLISQMRRASYGIATNIAECNGRKTKKDRSHFLDIAMGSIDELHYQCILTRDLGYITEKECAAFHDQIQRTGYLIHKLQQSLSSSLSSHPLYPLILLFLIPMVPIDGAKNHNLRWRKEPCAGTCFPHSARDRERRIFINLKKTLIVGTR